MECQVVEATKKVSALICAGVQSVQFIMAFDQRRVLSIDWGTVPFGEQNNFNLCRIQQVRRMNINTIIVSLVIVLSFASGCITGPMTFTVGGSLNGLTGTLNLTNSSTGQSMDFTGDSFTFMPQDDNTPYTVVVSAQPEGQTCMVSNGTGVVSAADVIDVEVNCVTHWLGTQQFGSSQRDEAFGMAIATDGSMVLAGYSYDPVDGEYKGTVWKRESSGAAVWTFLDGHANSFFRDVVVDENGNVYVVGVYDNVTDSTGNDAYFIKLDSDGTLVWQITLGGPGVDDGQSILLSTSGQLYVTGTTTSLIFEGQSNAGNTDVFVTHIDVDGAVGWTALLGDSSANRSDLGGIAEAPTGELVVCYSTDPATPPTYTDIVVAKLEGDGNLVTGWPVVIQQGDSADVPSGRVAVDPQGNIYLSGRTSSSSLFGEINSGALDAFVVKISGVNGMPVWGRLLGGLSSEYGFDIDLDNQNSVVLVGKTYGALPGELNSGGQDIFVAKWDASGNALWMNQTGSSADDFPYAIGFDPLGKIVIGGFTNGNLDGNTSLGNQDVFLMKLDTVSGSIYPPGAP